MSRAAVFAVLKEDPYFNNIVPAQNVLVNYSGEGRPSNLDPKPFIILRWEETSTTAPKISSVMRTLTVWAHQPAEKSTDYAILDDILSSVKTILTRMEHEEGLDGHIVTCIEYQGDSPDLKDDAFNTISKNSTFKVLSRPAVVI